MEDDVAVMPDDDDRAGKLIVRDGVVDDGVDGGKGGGRDCLLGNSRRRILRGTHDRRRDDSDECNDGVSPETDHATVALSVCGSSRLAM